MKIRVAEWQDMASLVDIYNQAITAGQKTADFEKVTITSRKSWFEAHPPQQYPILVAENNQHHIMGYATISAYRAGRPALRFTAEISYYVHFDYHRQGVASALMQSAINQCPTLQIKTLIAILLASNQHSIQLLKKYGFEEWGHMPNTADFDGIEVGHLYYGLRIRSKSTYNFTVAKMPGLS